MTHTLSSRNLISLVAACVLLAAPAAHAEYTSASRGFLDLSGWDFAADGSVPLHGEWEFYWQRLLKPGDFEGPDMPAPSGLIGVPGSWNGYLEGTGDSPPLPGDGFATYRLRLDLTGSSVLSNRDARMSLYIPYVNTAYRLWIDGRLAASNGHVATSRGEAIPQLLPVIASFRPQGETVEVVVQVANFAFREGGLGATLTLGGESQVALEQSRQEIIDASLFASALLIAFVHLSLYAWRRQDRSPLYFGLFMLVIAARIPVTGEYILARAFPGITYEGLVKHEYLTGYLIPGSFMLFLRSLFPRETSIFVVRFGIGMGIVGLPLTLATPVRFSSLFIPTDIVLSGALAIYCVGVVIAAAIRRREGALLFLAGGIAFLMSVVLTMLHYSRVAAVGDLLPFGAIALVLSQTLIVTRRSALAFHRQAALSRQNAELLRKTQGQLEEVRHYRRLMTLREESLRRRIAEMLHGRTQARLLAAGRNAAQAAEAITGDPATARTLLAEVGHLLDQVREEDIRDAGRRLHPEAIRAGLVAALESLLEPYDGSHHVHFEVDPRVERLDEPGKRKLPEDLCLGLYRILEEGLNNISRHANARTINVSLSLLPREDCDQLSLSLADDGTGFDTTSHSTGLGLQTIGARVGDLKGDLKITSLPNQGTTLTITVPLNDDKSSYPSPSLPERRPAGPRTGEHTSGSREDAAV